MYLLNKHYQIQKYYWKVTIMRMVKILLMFIVSFVMSFIFSTCDDKKSNPTEPTWKEMENDWWGNYPELGTGTAVFDVSPMDSDHVSDIFPLGHIFHHKDNTPSHPIPTDHMYWTPSSDITDRSVRAPARAIITKINYSSVDYSIVLTYTNSFKTIFWHVSELDSSIVKSAGSIKIGDNKTYIKVEAGQRIGKANALDIGAYDRDTMLTFIHPEKYVIPTPHTVCPLDYFREPLKTKLYGYVKRRIEPRGGKINFDEYGKLVGNWFVEGTKNVGGNDGYKKFIAFVYDALDPRYLRVSLGVEMIQGGLLARVQNNAPDFKNIDVKSGEVIYKLMEVGEGDEFWNEQSGTPMPDFVIEYTLLVKLLDNEKIKVELFNGDVQSPAFTQAAKIYTR